MSEEPTLTVRLPSTVVNLRDQAEGHLLRQMNYTAARMDLPERSLNKSARDVDQGQDQLDDISSGQIGR